MAKQATRTTVIGGYRYMGREPEFSNNQLSELEMLNSYSWYNYFHNTDDAKRFIREFCEKNGITKVNLSRHNNNTFGWIARMLSRGAVFPRHVGDRFVQYLSSLRVSDEKINYSSKSTNNPIGSHIAEIDSVCDSVDSNFSIYQYLTDNTISATHARLIAEYYAPIYQEVQDAYNKVDPQLVEAYSVHSRTELKALVLFYKNMMEDINKYLGNINVAKKPRKPRKARARNLAVATKHFQYLDKFDKMKLVSASPESIIGSSAVYLFNTGTNVLTKIVAESGNTLDIRRSMIINHDQNQSGSKRIGRKADTILNEIIGGTKRSRIKTFDGINAANAAFTNRSNSKTIIIKVDK